MTRWRRILYQPNLPLGADGKHVTACPEHIELSKNAAKEGMVLLKNQHGLLPLAKGTRLAVFGKAQIDYIQVGGGSGIVAFPIRNGHGKLRRHADVILLGTTGSESEVAVAQFHHREFHRAF